MPLLINKSSIEFGEMLSVSNYGRRSPKLYLVSKPFRHFLTCMSDFIGIIAVGGRKQIPKISR